LKSNSRLGQYFHLAVIAVIALSVLILSWPRLQASYRYLPVDIAIKRYYSTSEIPTDRLPVLIRFANEALQKNDHYRYHDGLSLLHILRAIDLNTPALERREAYELSESELIESLKRAPSQPALWLRLARVRWILHDEPKNVISAWKMSVFTGRTEVSQLVQRAEIGLAHYPFLDEESISMLRSQLLLAWRLKSGSLAQVLARMDADLSTTRKLIENTDPVAIMEMQGWLEKFR
jgi:hypothetical protein